MPPYPLPGGANVSGIKSNSTKGGGGHNGLIMDDSKGKEMMTLHAQKDLDATIQNNETRTVVSGTQTVTVKGDTSLTVQAGNRSVSVASGDYTGTAKKAVKLHGETEGVKITGDAKGVNVAGTGEGVNVVGKGGPGVKIDGTPNFEAHGASLAKMTSPKVEIGDAVIDIKGSTITIDGSSTIKLVSGGSSIEIAPGGINVNSSAPITITGAVVKVNS
jgi:type VI secretion system secreted protein VgrG